MKRFTIVGGQPSDYNKYRKFRIKCIDARGEEIRSSLPTFFTGVTSSCAPYFIISGKFTFDTSKGAAIYSKPKALTFEKINPTTITVDEYNYFMLEIAPTPKQVVKLRRIFDLLPMPVEEFRRHKYFAKYNLNSLCSYFRIDYEAPLRILFSGQKKISGLDAVQLVKLSTMVAMYPWKACFSKFIKEDFGLKEATYEGFHSYRLNCRSQTLPPIQPLFLRAIRLYSYIRGENEKGNELFRTSTLFQEYRSDEEWGPIAFENNDSCDALVPALEFLMFHALIDANYMNPAPTGVFPEFVATIRDVTINRDIIDSLCGRMATKSNEMTKTLQSIYSPCIPSPLLTGDQVNFVKHALTNRISLLEGAPGTGKTEVLVAVFAHLARRKLGNPPVGPLVATFVSNMVESLRKRFGNRPETANTIHYICCMVETGSQAAKEWINHFNVLILDEGSNIDAKLFGRLLHSLPNVAQLIIVGDLGQIFPIKSGAPFCDLVATFPQHAFLLTENKRVERDSLALAEAAALIRGGRSREIQFSTDKAAPLRFMVRSDDRVSQLASIIGDIVKNVEDIMKLQVVVLRNKDRKELNRIIEDILIKKGILKNPGKSPIYLPCGPVFPGRKLVFTKNYKSDGKFDGVRNGEMGQVKRYINGKVFEFTSGKRISLDLVDPSDIAAGYATTCNRSQGSEWNNVIVWIYENPNPFFTREYAYVGISRAKKQCIVVGKEEEFHKMCSEKAKERHTLLRFYLYLERESLGGIELARLNSYENVHLIESKEFRLLPPDQLAVPVPKEQPQEEKQGGKKAKQK